MNKLLATLALSAAAWLPMATSAAPVLSITPSTTAVAVGQSFTVDITISGLNTVGEIASAFDLNVLFDDALLDSTSTFFLFALFGGGANVDINSTFNLGNVGSIMNSFSSDADLALLQTANSFTLISLSFTAQAVGDSLLSFGPDVNFERLVVGRNGAPLSLSYVGACVSVGASAPGGGCQNTVPEPASFALVGLALLVGGAASRKGLRTMARV